MHKLGENINLMTETPAQEASTGTIDFMGPKGGMQKGTLTMNDAKPAVEGSFFDKAKVLGAPAVSLGMGGLEASDFYNEPDFSDPRDKYNPYSKLNLNKDTGISTALAADTGLRLFAEGGNVAGDQKQALNLNNSGNVAGSNVGIGGLNLNTGQMGVSPADLAAAAIAAKPKTPPMKLVMGRGMMPVGAIEAGPAANYSRNLGGRGYTFKGKQYGMPGYAEGGYLKGPGDGMSDDIPATINGEQPAALADGEFVVPADVVSHLGNGSSEAGSKQLYAMMDRIRKARTGRESQGKEIKPEKYMPR